jgi:hypothetical protein
MRKAVGTLLLTGVLLVAMMGISYGITNGVPDGANHPYVGLLVFDDAPAHPAWRCSGSLLSPTIVLTAGHCTDGAVAARVWFAADVQANSEYPFSGTTSYDGTPNTHPDFCIGCAGGLPGFAINDVGIVVLSEAVPTSAVSEYASLPALGAVDLMANKTKLDLVGYGVQFQISGKGGVPPRLRWTGPRIRMYAPTELVSGRFVHSTDFIRTAMNPGGGSGGTCFGDSGGPILEGGTSTVLAVNSYVTNVNCTGVGYAARVDTDSALEFIGEFFPE